MSRFVRFYDPELDAFRTARFDDATAALKWRDAWPHEAYYHSDDLRHPVVPVEPTTPGEIPTEAAR